MGNGTVGIADIYGRASSANGAADPLGIRNANGGTVAPAATSTASGGGVSSGTGAAISVIGLISALVLWRVFIELQKGA